MSDIDIARQLTRIEQGLEALETERLESRHTRLKTAPSAGESAAEAEEAALDLREAELLGDAAYQSALEAATAAGASGYALSRGTEPEIRRLDLHRRLLLGALVRLDPAVAPLIRTLRAELETTAIGIDGAPAGRMDRLEALRHQPDRDLREAAWFGLTPLAESVESSLVRLLEERNRAAALFGFEMFPDLAFESAELSRIEFMATCDELEQLTRPIYEQFLSWCRREQDGAPLEPWDLDFLLTRLEEPAAAWPRRGQVALAQRLLAEQGLGVEGVTIDIAPEGSPWGARVMAIRPPGDVRVLVNPRDGLVHLEIGLAALGRALRHRNAPEQESAWRRDAEIVAEMTSGVAARIGMRSVEASLGDDRNVAWRRWRGVYRLRRAMAAGMFEMLAYEHVGSDLHGLWSEVHEQYLGFNRHPERLWPAALAMTTDPFRVARTLMGGLAADQIVTALDGRHGAGPWPPDALVELRETLWTPGARLSWESRIASLTGRGLDPEATLRRLGADLGA